MSESVKIALEDEEKKFHQNDWQQSLSSTNTLRSWGGKKFGSRIVDTHSYSSELPKEKLFVPIKNIGGKNGWYYANWLWKIRGYLDVLFGGVGMRRSRSDDEDIRVGDIIDWWRVDEYRENEVLRLFSEMKLPGRAWLEFRVKEEDGISTIEQTAIFDPVGLSGLLYWYILYPIHNIIFSGMVRNIVKKAGTN